MNINLITQKHNRGCGVACLAMITGKSYDEILEDCEAAWDEQTGLYTNIVDAYLWDHGYALRKYYSNNNWQKIKRDPWPIKPFTDIHLVHLRVYELASCEHFVIMSRDGTVLDPKLGHKPSLADYYNIYSISGIYYVGDK